MLKAISMIQKAKSSKEGLTVDLHPDRPTYRGIATPKGIISLERDPTWEEIEATGAKVEKHSQTHAILDGHFLVSGEIPRVTAYEPGVLRGVKYDDKTHTWEKDELILDERFLMCKVKGNFSTMSSGTKILTGSDKGIVVFTGCSHAGVVNVVKHALSLAGEATPLYAVVGGYHLVGPNEAYIKETVQDLKALNPQILMPGHCSGWRAKHEIANVLPGRLAPSTVGTKFVF